MSNTGLQQPDWIKLLSGNPTPLQQTIFKNISPYLNSDSEGILRSEQIYKNIQFFHPYLFTLKSPYFIPEMQNGVEELGRFYKSQSKKKIVIYADRDADGISSASILFLYLIEKLGMTKEQIVVMIPKEEDKYGITAEIAERIIQENPSLLFTLDCGSSNQKEIKLIKEALLEISIIIMDHHTLPENQADYPQVEAFINPCRLPLDHEKYGLCTGALVFMFIWAFTYSLTEEYNKVTLLKSGIEEIFIKNGVPMPENSGQKADKIFFYKAKKENDEGYDLQQLVDNYIIKNSDFSKLMDNIKRIQIPLKEVHLFTILKNLSMQKIFLSIKRYLPLAAIATIADSMTLMNDNRVIVNEGLKAINEQNGEMINGLKEILKLSANLKYITEKDIAFSVAPMINAAGRMGQAIIAYDAIVENDLIAGAKQAFLLKKLNEERKELSKKAMDLLNPEKNQTINRDLVIGYHEGIHRGISGIVASRLCDLYTRPALVLVDDGNCIRGSIRAFNNEDVLSLIKKMSEWFIQYGGHKNAAGFSLDYALKEDFIKEILAISDGYFYGSKESATIALPGHYFIVNDYELSTKLWNEIKVFAPYGNGHPHPVLLVRITKPVQFKLIGSEKLHARLSFSGPFAQNIDCVWFFHGGQIESIADETGYFLAAEPHFNYFQGVLKSQLQIVKKLNLPL